MATRRADLQACLAPVLHQLSDDERQQLACLGRVVVKQFHKWHQGPGKAPEEVLAWLRAYAWWPAVQGLPPMQVVEEQQPQQQPQQPQHQPQHQLNKPLSGGDSAELETGGEEERRSVAANVTTLPLEPLARPAAKVVPVQGVTSRWNTPYRNEPFQPMPRRSKTPPTGSLSSRLPCCPPPVSTHEVRPAIKDQMRDSHLAREEAFHAREEAFHANARKPVRKEREEIQYRYLCELKRIGDEKRRKVDAAVTEEALFGSDSVMEPTSSIM